MTAATPGTVYLLHFDQPYRHARHYTGWTTDLDARLAAHADGTGARLLAVVHAAGISWTLARTWPGDRTRERQLKTTGGASRRCPLCGIRPRRQAALPEPPTDNGRWADDDPWSAASRPADPAHSRQAHAGTPTPTDHQTAGKAAVR